MALPHVPIERTNMRSSGDDSGSASRCGVVANGGVVAWLSMGRSIAAPGA